MPRASKSASYSPLTLKAVWYRCGGSAAVLTGEEVLNNDLVEEFSRAIHSDRVECSAQNIAVEMASGDAVIEEPTDGDVREELRIQVELPFGEPGAVGCHGLDNPAVDEVVVPCLWDGTGDDPGDAEGVEGPKEHGKQILTTNMVVQTNRELERRTKVVEVFPNEESHIRLVGAILMDVNEDWVVGGGCLTMRGDEQAKRRGSDKLQKI